MNGWALTRIAAPATALISTAAAKNHLRVDTSDDDDLIDQIIDAATGRAEEHTSRQFITATWRLTLDSWPGGDIIRLPRPPVQAVTSVQFEKADGTTGTVDSGDYFLDSDSEPGRLVLADGKSWPSDELRPAAAVKVTYTAGYGDDAADVPGPITSAVKLIIGSLYEHRESVVVGTIATPMPQSSEWLLFPYRVWWF